MQIEFTEQEIKILVDSLRSTEKLSRKGFAETIVKKMSDPDIGGDDLLQKMANARRAFLELVTLRKKLGDERPVNF